MINESKEALGLIEKKLKELRDEVPPRNFNHKKPASQICFIQ